MYIYFLSLGLNTITFQILAPRSNACVYKCLGNRSTNHLTLCCVWRCRVAGSGCPGAGGGSCNYIVEPMMVQGGSSPPPPHTSQLSGFLMILVKLSCQSTKFQQSPAAAQTIPAVVSPGITLAVAPPPAPGQTNVIMQLHQWCVGEPDRGVQPSLTHIITIRSHLSLYLCIGIMWRYISISSYLDILDGLMLFWSECGHNSYWCFNTSKISSVLHKISSELHHKIYTCFIRFLQSFIIRFLLAA